MGKLNHRRRSAGTGAGIVLSGLGVQAEGTAIGTTIGTLSVINGTGTYTFTKTGDPDSAFTLTAGALKNAIVFDFETAALHSFTVHADNGAGSTFDLTNSIGVTDVTAPIITSSAAVSVAENATLAHSLTANESVTWSEVAGGDAAKLEISGSTVRWTANGTKDYEAPDDANTDNVYVYTVRATTVATGETTDQTISVTVTDVAEPVPVNSVAPAVTGTETEGETLSCSTGTWTNSPTSYAYQWYQSVTSGGVPTTDGDGNYIGIAISGETASTYVLQAGVGELIFCDVIASNATGPSVIPKSSNVTGVIAAAPSEDALTTAWASAVVGDGGTVGTTRRGHVDTLIAGLRSDGLISKIDRLWIFAAENEKSALRDLIAAALAVSHDGGGGAEPNKPTFTTDLGFQTTDGGDGYIDTGFNASTAGGVYTQNSAHMSLWNLTNTTSNRPSIAVGGGATAGENLYVDLGGDCYMRVNDNPEAGGLAIADPRGHLLGNRSSATLRQAYRNATSLGSLGSVASQALINGNFLALTLNGTIGASSPFQLAMLGFGSSLTSGEATSYYNRLRTYMTAVGVP